LIGHVIERWRIQINKNPKFHLFVLVGYTQRSLLDRLPSNSLGQHVFNVLVDAFFQDKVTTT